MASNGFFKRIQVGLNEDPWLFMGSVAVLVFLALLTFSASMLRDTEPRAGPPAGAATSSTAMEH